jgi:PhoPQ-activated pathogenicity-related protein
MHFVPQNSTYSYCRYDGNEAVFVFINASQNAIEIPWESYVEIMDKFQTGYSILEDKTIRKGEKVIVEPFEAIVIEYKQALSQE